MAKTKNKEKVTLNENDLPDDGGRLSPGPGRESYKLASYWKEQVDMYDQAASRYIKRGNIILKRFRDDRSKTEEDSQRRMNILWAYVKILMPALYGKCPIPNIDRKFLDRDPVGRLSAKILERASRNEIKQNNLHSALKKAVLDYLLVGRGVIWVRYEPEIEESSSIPGGDRSGLEDELDKIIGRDKNTPEEEQLEDTGSQLIAEKAPVDYIDFKDIYFFPAKARVWEEVKAVGKKVYISKKEAIERFGKEIGKAMVPHTQPMTARTDRPQYSDVAVFHDLNERSIEVFEIWNKSDRRVYWHSTGYDFLCDVREDPLQLKNFFPTPEPISATLTNDTFFPVPDFWEWQDQAIQIDELTQRIALLTQACKVAGTYDSSVPQLKRILEEGTENSLIPVDAWAVHADKGGVKGAMSFLPIEEIQAVLATLREVRAEIKQDLDEVTGVNDVLRGTTDSRETLGGIRLKNNNTGTRLSDRQDEIARFARDTIAIIAEIISKHFSDDALLESSGILYDEELDPDHILSEIYTALGIDPAQQQQAQQGKGAPGAAQGPQGQPPPTPLALPPPGPPQGQMPPTPQPGAPPGPPQGNVVPFPGGPQPPQPEPVPLQPQEPQAPQLPEVSEDIVNQVIAHKIAKSIELLREDVMRNYRIEIETDSTIYGDRTQERQDASEFLTAVTGFMAQAEQIGMTVPESMPLMGRFLQWGVRKFRTGRDLEGAIDEFVAKMDKKSKAMANMPPSDPKQQEIEAKIKIEERKAQMQADNDTRDMQRQMQQDMRKHQLEEQDDLRKMEMQKREDERQAQMAEMERQFKEKEYALKEKEMMMKHQLEVHKHNMEMQKMGMQVQAEQQSQQMDIQAKQQDAQINSQMKEQELAQSERQHQQTMEQGDQQHRQSMEQANTSHSQKIEQANVTHKQKTQQMSDQAKYQSQANKQKLVQQKQQAASKKVGKK